MEHNTRSLNLPALLRRRPQAYADMAGSVYYPEIHGTVRFYETPLGVVVAAEIAGLPSPAGRCGSPVFGFHIHAGNACTRNTADPFADVGSHYNPHNCDHPHHAGDLPPLFGNDGYALSLCLTHRFFLRDIIGKTVIIHAAPDDFTTQPAGNAGEKIACGVIKT